MEKNAHSLSKQEAAAKRSEELTKQISDYQDALINIPSGMKRWTNIVENQKRIK